jgi:hypothetical protein
VKVVIIEVSEVITIHTHLLKQLLENVLFAIPVFVKITEVAIVFLFILRVGQSVHCVIVELHAELNALVEHLLWLVRSILIDKS